MRILSRDEATKVERPEGMEPYVWPEPANVAISRSGPVSDHVYGRARNGDPLAFALAVNFFETLYDRGYVIAKVDDEGPLDAILRVADYLMLALVRGDDAKPVLERYRQMILELPGEVVRAPKRMARIQSDSNRLGARIQAPNENSPGAILVDAAHEQWLAEGTE